MISVIVLGKTSLRFSPDFEVIISTVKGHSAARNVGAALAHGDILLFLDGDQSLKEGFFSTLDLKLNEFKMTKVGKYPCSRAVLISKADFQRVSGFDESLIDAPEDVDFYFRALDKGMRFSEFPNLFDHEEHRRPSHQYRKILGNIKVGLKHIRRHPDYLKFELVRTIRQIL